MRIWRNRAIWLAVILAAGLLYFFDNQGGTLALLIGVTALPILGGILSFFQRNQVSFSLKVPKTGEKNQGLEGVLRMEKAGWLPLRIRGKLCCRNIHTGEEQGLLLETGLFRREERNFEFCPKHCGKLEISMENAEILDPFGLFSFQISENAREETMILPELFPVELSVGNLAADNPDSEEYSPFKPGNDPGETYAIREYAPGDGLRRIHWKLTEKMDKTMVRDFGLPVVSDLLVLLDFGGSDPEHIDGGTEIAASLLQALEGRSYDFGRMTPEGNFDLLAVRQEGAFPFLLEELLSRPPEGISVTEAFLNRYHHCGYSHVILVGSEIPAWAGELYNDNRVTLVTPGEETLFTEGDGIRHYVQKLPGAAVFLEV